MNKIQSLQEVFQLGRIAFVYTFQCVGKDGKVKWEETLKNLTPTAALNYMISAALDGGAQLSTWYIGLSETNYTPLATDTMATLLAAITELTSEYDEATRVALTAGAVASGLYSNTASPAEFTFNSAASVRLGFLTSGSVKGNNSGTLLSAVLFPSPRVMADGDILKVTAGVQLVAA